MTKIALFTIEVSSSVDFAGHRISLIIKAADLYKIRAAGSESYCFDATRLKTYGAQFTIKSGKHLENSGLSLELANTIRFNFSNIYTNGNAIAIAANINEKTDLKSIVDMLKEALSKKGHNFDTAHVTSNNNSFHFKINKEFINWVQKQNVELDITSIELCHANNRSPAR